MQLLIPFIIFALYKINMDMDKKSGDLAECPGCNKIIELSQFVCGTGVCPECYEKEIWVDPAGGVHHGNDADYDPAQMYE